MSNPQRQCEEAMRKICDIRLSKRQRVSSLYRSEPVGYKDQNWFVNAVCEIRSLLPARELLEELKGIEKLMGRLEGSKWGPRIIDLDILLYGQEIMNESDIKVPHQELHKRRFVLKPMCEIAPYVIHPVYGISMQGLLDRLTDNDIVERIKNS